MTKKDTVKEIKKEMDINFKDVAVYRETSKLKGLMDLNKESLDIVSEVLRWYDKGAEITDFKKLNHYMQGMRIEFKDGIELENNEERLYIVFHEYKNKGYWCEEQKLIGVILKKG